MMRLLLALLFVTSVAEASTIEEVTVYSGTVTASADLTTVSLGGTKAGVCVLKTTAITLSPTLDVYLQSFVGGVDDDYCRFAQVTGTNTQIVRWGTPAVASGAAVTPSDRSSGLSASACRSGIPGARLKVAATLGGTGTATIVLTCHLLKD